MRLATEQQHAKMTLWSLEQFLMCAGKETVLEELSQGLKLSLISSNDFREGLRELLMVFSKSSTLK